MSMLSSARLRGPSRYMSLPMAGDELETWTKEELVEMDRRFTDRLEQAFELGLESRASAAGQVKLPANSGLRWSTPLCSTVSDGLLRSTAAGETVFVARR
jgi:hypothetical protein